MGAWPAGWSCMQAACAAALARQGAARQARRRAALTFAHPAHPLPALPCRSAGSFSAGVVHSFDGSREELEAVLQHDKLRCAPLSRALCSAGLACSARTHATAGALAPHARSACPPTARLACPRQHRHQRLLAQGGGEPRGHGGGAARPPAARNGCALVRDPAQPRRCAPGGSGSRGGGVGSTTECCLQMMPACASTAAFNPRPLSCVVQATSTCRAGGRPRTERSTTPAS